MLGFKLSLAWRILSLRSLSKTSWTCKRVSSNSKDSFDDKKNRCLEHRRALEKCPKENLVKRCRKKIFADNIPRSKCSWSNADDYRRAYEAIKIRSEKLTKLVEITVTTIVQDIQSEMTKIRCVENSFAKRILQSVEPKILELSDLDPVCAMQKKRDVFALNDRAQRELTNIHFESQLAVKSIEGELEKLSRELKFHNDCALGLVSSCRESTSPQALIHCVEHSSREAAKILDDVKNDFETRIKNVEIAKEEIIKEDKKIVEQVIKIYERNMKKLIAGLIDCIRDRKSN